MYAWHRRGDDGLQFCPVDICHVDCARIVVKEQRLAVRAPSDEEFRLSGVRLGQRRVLPHFGDVRRRYPGLHLLGRQRH